MDALTADAVVLQDLRFAYDTGREVLDIKALRIARGESVFLHGPSGSGKTTLLSVISGVLRPQAGLVRVLGQDMRKLSAAARDNVRGADMGYIFQGFNLIPYLSVQENLVLPCRLHPQRLARIGSATLLEEAVRLAKRLDIQAYLRTSVTRLSVGQQQRVAIARAVIGSPALLIADEPTSSLDSDRRDSFLQLLLDVTGESRAAGSAMTLLFVSHDLELAGHFDRTLSLGTINRSACASEAVP